MNGIAEIDRFLQGAVDRNEIPGVVAIVASKDQILYHQAFGMMDVANQVEMRRDTIFDIASMTKPVTSVAVMMLHEQGKLDLDDAISKYIPSLENPEVITRFDKTEVTYATKPADNKITIQHLLSHTAGFGYGFSNRTLHLLEQKTGKTARELPLLHEPGARWTYGLNTRVLGELVEEIAGVSLDEFFRAAIFGPLGMDDTFYSLPRDSYTRWVTSHRRVDGALIETARPDTQQTAIFGDYGLLSTAGDYITFLQMLLNGGTLHDRRILGRGSVDLMMRNQIGELVVETQPGADPTLSRAFPLGAGRDKFGLGFQITAAPGEGPALRSPGSCSWAGIMNTHFWIDPQRGIAAVILMQVLPFYDDACIRAYRGFEELIYRNLD
jgi:methyl acetate hydrolase